MAIRIKYTYTVYEDLEAATEISKSRARNAQFIMMWSGFGILASLICLFVDFSETWPMLFLLLVCVLGMVSLFSGHYDAVTQKKINQAIAKYISGNKHFIESDKKIDSIDIASRIIVKHCMGCGNVAPTQRCVIRKNGHAIGLPLCEKCISKLKVKVKSKL